MKLIENPIIAITGHRPHKLKGGYDLSDPKNKEIQHRIELAFKRLKPDIVLSGMALGIDQMAALSAIKLKIPFIACIPFKGQETLWPLKSQELYKKLLDKALKVEYICDPGYASWKMQRRNEHMVDSSDILLAIYNGDLEGGTYNCIKYAEKKNKQIEYILLRKEK